MAECQRGSWFTLPWHFQQEQEFFEDTKGEANYIVHFTCDIIIKFHTPKCCILEMTVS
jgi:hypothetical protein